MANAKISDASVFVPVTPPVDDATVFAAELAGAQKGPTMGDIKATVLGAPSPFSTTPQGRLTLTSGQPVMTADVTASSHVYYDPYVGNVATVWDGAAWVAYQFAELDMILNTGQQLQGKVYDLFLFVAAGVLAIGAGSAWTDGVTRSAAIDQSLGLWTNAASIDLKNDTNTTTVAAHQATYVGSVYMSFDDATATMIVSLTYADGGNNPHMGVYNAYNRVEMSCGSGETSGGYTTSSNTAVPLNNSDNNRVTWLDGLGQSFLSFDFQVYAVPGGGSQAGSGVQLDSTSGIYQTSVNAEVTGVVTLSGKASSPPLLGVHYAQMMMLILGGSSAATFYNGQIITTAAL